MSVGISLVNNSSISVEFYFVHLIGSKSNIRVEACKKKSLRKSESVANNLAQYFNEEVIDYSKK